LAADPPTIAEPTMAAEAPVTVEPTAAGEPPSRKGRTGRTARRRRARFARWRSALHEAGHVVAALVFNREDHVARTVRAVVAKSGACTICVPPLTGYEEAFEAACGPAAEFLAEKVRPPGPVPTCRRRRPGPSEPAFLTRMTDYECARPHPLETSDERRIALWAINGIEGEPERWAERVTRLRWHTYLFVRDAAGPILAAARRLYREGGLTVTSFEDLKEKP